MKLSFLSDAGDELKMAAAYYEEREEGLGTRFRDEVSKACQRILQDPYLWRERRGGYRRVNLPVFPYYVAYFVRDDAIIIAAISHGHRLPGYWRRRVP